MTNLLVITGPTASGKTRRAVALAQRLNGEIISADSRQIYRGMDIGTGKDLDEYGDVPYHLIDICPAGYKYNLFEYIRDFAAAEQSIRSRNRLPIVCGGTGLYVESVLNGLRLPEVPQNDALRRQLATKSLDELKSMLEQMKTLHNTTDVDTPKRAIRAIEIQTYYREHPELAVDVTPQPRTDYLLICVDIDRESRRRRITDEIRQLIADGVAPDDLIYYGLEYKFITRYVIGECTYDEMFAGLEIAIHQFAKRQMRWFRGMERRGFTIHRLPYDMGDDEFVDAVCELMSC